MDFPIFNTKLDGVSEKFDLNSPEGRAKYFQAKAGPEIEKLSDEALAARTDKLDVCCRVSPQHKTRIVDALKAREHVVAMTEIGRASCRERV